MGDVRVFFPKRKTTTVLGIILGMFPGHAPVGGASNGSSTLLNTESRENGIAECNHVLEMLESLAV